jgi:hypothetical protein
LSEAREKRERSEREERERRAMINCYELTLRAMDDQQARELALVLVQMSDLDTWNQDPAIWLYKTKRSGYYRLLGRMRSGKANRAQCIAWFCHDGSYIHWELGRAYGTDSASKNANWKE